MQCTMWPNLLARVKSLWTLVPNMLQAILFKWLLVEVTGLRYESQHDTQLSMQQAGSTC